MKATLLLFLLGAGCGGISQAKACEQYLACSEAVQPMSTQQSRITYGPGGTCWMNEGDAEGCAEICKLAVQALQLGSGMSTPECM